MKTFFRYFLFLSHYALVVILASAGTDDNVSYLVGNDYGVGPGRPKSGEKQAPVQTLLSNSGIQQAQIT